MLRQGPGMWKGTSKELGGVSNLKVFTRHDFKRSVIIVREEDKARR